MNVSKLPGDIIVGWVEESQQQINRYNEIVKEEAYDDYINLPTYVYFTVIESNVISDTDR